jgi:hypothetical protein
MNCLRCGRPGNMTPFGHICIPMSLICYDAECKPFEVGCSNGVIETAVWASSLKGPHENLVKKNIESLWKINWWSVVK